MNLVFVRGFEAAGLATINTDASQSEAEGLVIVMVRLWAENCENVQGKLYK